MTQQGMNVGKGIGLLVFTNELAQLFWDLRWAIILMCALIVADLWFGISAAKSRNEKIRRSRAIRRTANKFIDYIMYMLVAAVIGMVVEQIGWCSHTKAALCGILLGSLCEIDSIVGHIAELHGANFSLWSFLRSLISKRRKDIGEAIEDGMNGK